ncbi:conserved phage C-terminal domain-containing protein [Enterococcus dongliensis]|uniref:conserved phage C-terminal domain-containing protein n=1 Tax=Enterococcus dongliensis TaxID=2559925 RepID=UPI00289178E4|nr:conserved phage C-terminal domain-containing protein [Enterococcus dongliensis]MDT2640428.1 conserved phage C-terminal domain-containing protein [Enterococcus dongliensis]
MPERKFAKANRGFKGIWIPASSWLDENLTIQEMLFLAEIDSLDIDEKGCYATNKHFSDFFGLTAGRCSQVITSLKEKGYIEVELVFNKKKDIKNRTIKVVNKLNTPIKNIKGGYLENCARSNTSFSNTKDILSSSEKIPYSEIISYLNQVTNKKYKVTQKWKDLIKARWNEGQRLDDFKKVIDVKTGQWINNQEMNKYLRPATLFGNKFDDYLNEYRPQISSSISDEIAESQRKIAEAYEQ